MKPLNKGERFFLFRRREGMSQHEASVKFGLPLVMLSQIEHGHVEHENLPDVELGKLTQQEVCIVQRRRSGMSQLEVARCLGYKSRHWVRLMEQAKAPCDKLVEYWNTKK